jgi:sugar phosphate permease
MTGEHRTKKIFYGWWIVVAGFFISMYMSGSITFGFTAFFEPIVEEFGWSHSQVAFVASLRGIEAGIFAPLVGMLVDRWGPRKLVVIGAIVSGIAMLLFSQVNSLAMFYGVFLLVGLGMSLCLGVVPITAASNWFRRKMPLAVGIVVSGTGASGLLLPLFSSLIDTLQWRTVAAMIGIGMWCIVLPLGLILRHRPEQYGYAPDGITDPDEKKAVEETRQSQSKKSIKQIMTSGIFWQIVLVYICGYMVITSVQTHNMPYLGSLGIDRLTASMVAGGLPLFTILGRIGFGWLGNNVDAKRLSMSTFFFVGLGTLCYRYIDVTSMWLIFPFLFLFGVGYGGTVPMLPVMVREYISKRRFGLTLGFAMGLMTLGQLIGPPLAGWVYDTWNSYHSIWLIFAGLMFAVIAGVATLPSAGKNKEQMVELENAGNK